MDRVEELIEFEIKRKREYQKAASMMKLERWAEMHGEVADALQAALDAYRREKTMIPFPDKKYSVIYADPPWSYRNKGTRAAADNHYQP